MEKLLHYVQQSIIQCNYKLEKAELVDDRHFQYVWSAKKSVWEEIETFIKLQMEK